MKDSNIAVRVGDIFLTLSALAYMSDLTLVGALTRKYGLDSNGSFLAFVFRISLYCVSLLSDFADALFNMEGRGDLKCQV